MSFSLKKLLDLLRSRSIFYFSNIAFSFEECAFSCSSGVFTVQTNRGALKRHVVIFTGSELLSSLLYAIKSGREMTFNAIHVSRRFIKFTP